MKKKKTTPQQDWQDDFEDEMLADGSQGLAPDRVMSQDEELSLDDRRCFEHAMTQLTPGRKPTMPPPSEQVVELDISASDAALFDELVKTHIPTSKDEHDSSQRSSVAIANRRRRVSRGQIEPDAVLDLHGYTVEGARHSLARFVRMAASKGSRVLLLIVGRGIHSNAGPVVKTAVESWLKHDPLGLVGEFYTAPRSQGGDGALLVFLRAGK